MSFQIELDPFEEAFVYFVRQIRDSIQRTFEEEELSSDLTQKELATTLGVDQAVISRRLNGPGNITLRTLCDIFTAMGRLPLSNFVPPPNLNPWMKNISVYGNPPADQTMQTLGANIVQLNVFDNPRKSAA